MIKCQQRYSKAAQTTLVFQKLSSQSINGSRSFTGTTYGKYLKVKLLVIKSVKNLAYQTTDQFHY
jgi:hypothetical protein